MTVFLGAALWCVNLAQVNATDLNRATCNVFLLQPVDAHTKYSGFMLG